jgi:mono/diheme cytochrome c family protein
LTSGLSRANHVKADKGLTLKNEAGSSVAPPTLEAKMSSGWARALVQFLLVPCLALILTESASADSANGKMLATRWCAECHVVQQDQKLATDKAPTFASLARVPDFGANRLAFLLLKPHPNMPSLSLSRAEIADIAEYMGTLK